jgi:hypothetical protein
MPQVFKAIISGALNELKELLGDAVTLVIETIEMPFVLSTPTLALRFRQNNGPTPSGDYQPSRSLSMAGSGGYRKP